MTRILDAITAQPWAITQEALSTILSVASREAGDLEAVQAKLGRPLQNARAVTLRDGAAVIPLTGPIFRRANLFTQISGATSIEILARDFQAALDDPSVAAIILDIDSPGGEVNGVNEFASQIYAARQRKPVIAYVGNMAASAGYWIASAASEIVVDATAMLGSIGVVAAYSSERDSGTLEFTSSVSPKKRPDVGSSEGRRQIQDLIEATAEVFVGAVARNRGISAERVASDFGAGGMLVGEAAVKAGMADRLGSLEALIAQCGAGRRASRPGMAMPAPMFAADNAPIPPALLDALATDAQRVADALGNALHVLSPAPAGPDTTPTATQEMTPMADEQTQAQPTPEPPAPPVDLSNDPQMREQLAAFAGEQRQWILSQMEAVRVQAQAEARQLFEQQQGEQRREAAVTAFAQHVTTPTLARPHALPFRAEQVAEALRPLNDAQRAPVEALLRQVVESGLVAFDRMGSGAGAEEQRDAAEQYRAAVFAKTSGGMSEFDAIRAVNRERPELYAAMQQPKGGN
jgi:ClpP class serine protease